jgi:hypothetical protein
MFRFDLDLFGFLWTTASILFASKPQLRKNSKPIPVQYQRQFLQDSELSEAQREFLAPIDAQLLALNYRPFYTFRVTNYGSNLIRGYQNPTDPASCTLTIVEVRTNVKGVQGVKTSSVVSFTTRLSGERELVTRNLELKSVLDQPDYKIMQECPHVVDLTELKKKHDVKAAALGTPVAPPRDIPGVVVDFDNDNRRFAGYQVQHGTYRLNPQGDAYVITDKAFDRGIRNFFNPFAHRLSLTNILFSVLVGAVLPLYGILKLAPVMTERFGHTPVLLFSPATLAILACYILAGVILGFISETQSYVWVMLITYVPAHLVAGWTFGAFPYSLFAFSTAYFVCQAKRKRGVIFQS